VIDIQDIGSRFYTYESTLVTSLESAAITGPRSLWLDRANPLTGVHVQGLSRMANTSTLSIHEGTDSPWHDGGRVGEDVLTVERHINAKLTVVPVKGWTAQRLVRFPDLVWINLFAGICGILMSRAVHRDRILEYTNVSVVADGIRRSRCLVRRGSDHGIRAVSECTPNPRCPFVPTWFTPAKDAKVSGQRVGGVQMIVTDRSVLDAPELGFGNLLPLLKLYPADWSWIDLIDLLGNEST